MSSSQLSPRFVLWVIVSLITHLLELAASAVFCHMLLQQTHLKTPWFSVAAGLLILPLVIVQLASAVLLLRRKGESASSCEVTVTAVLHVLQLGFISRHFAVLQESALPDRKAEVTEMLLLRFAFGITSGCSLLVLQFYLQLTDAHGDSWQWISHVVVVISVVSITWALASFRRRLPEGRLDMELISWPGTVLRILWRCGELLVRTLALAMFTSIYTQWLFLVLGLHWLAMLACVCVPAITPMDVSTTTTPSPCRKIAFSIFTSFTYIFVFVNTAPENAVFRYTFYYVVLFLENSTLLAVWLIRADSDEFSRNCTHVYVAVVFFVVSIISMIVYYKFFHVPWNKGESVSACPGVHCSSCRSEHPPGHPPIPPRPGSQNSWLSQYQSAVYSGQYYKHKVHDSLLDSVSELNSSATTSTTHARLQHKLATIEDEVREREQTRREGQPMSKPAKPRRQKKLKLHGVTTSESELSSVRTDPSEESPRRPVWLPSGDSNLAHQLQLSYGLDNFDTAETADDERSSVAKGGRDLVLSALSPRRDGHHWYSDGYSTDRTLDWPASWPESDCPPGCTCSHGDSEVSSIMRSVAPVHEPSAANFDKRNPDLELGKCRKSRHDHCHHPHHHQHHSSRHRTEKHQHSADHTDRKKGEKMSRRAELISSPASDPSHGPRAKKNGSRKHQIPTLHEKHSLTTKKENLSCITKHLPHSMCSETFAESEKLATDLLKNSRLSPRKQKSNKTTDTSVSQNRDPRFNDRVVDPETIDLDQPDLKGDSDLKTSKSVRSHHNASKLDDKAKPTGAATDPVKSQSPPVDDVSVGTHQSDQLSPAPSIVETRLEDTANTSTSNSDTTGIVDDIIYENIWQGERSKDKSHQRRSRVTKTRTGNSRRLNKGDTRDVWYVCSESEDSALPPEAPSSSVEGFTDNDSEVSLEIVI